jgi:hypothetical protein
VTAGPIKARVQLAMLLALPGFASAAPGWISISECELNGFPLGGTVEQMREVLGEPVRSSLVKPAGNDYPNTEHHYDGLRIAFSMSGRSAITFVVTSRDYRLRSGIGVGSTRDAIESTLGPATEVRSDDSLDLVYGLTSPGGRHGFGQLMLKLENGVAVEMIAGWPSR